MPHYTASQAKPSGFRMFLHAFLVTAFTEMLLGFFLVFNNFLTLAVKSVLVPCLDFLAPSLLQMLGVFLIY